MDRIADLQEQRKVLWRTLRTSHELLVRAHKLCEALESRYNSDKEAYEKCDHSLAELDGRMHRLMALAAQSKVKVKAASDLTEEQIMRIAAELGIILEELEEVEGE